MSSVTTGKETTTSDAEPRRTSADIVAEHISWDIMTQRYRPGERMREEELSRKHDVSRTVIRDVLGRLASRGLVELHAWRGATIVHYPKAELSDLLDLNTLVYGFVAELAAERADADHIARMEAGLAEMAQAVEDNAAPEDFHGRRVAFYRALNDSTGSFRSARERANFPLTFYHQYVLADVMTPEDRDQQLHALTTLVSHIKARDKAAARECLTQDFREKRDKILAIVSETEG